MDKLKAGAERIGLNLGEKELKLFQVYDEELIDWNQRMNLTSITDYEKVQIDHFLDALTVAQVWKPENGGANLIDVGAGAGIPGIPLKIVFPQINLTLLDATTKKAGFLRHLVEKLELKDVNVVVGRAEDVAHRMDFREQFDVVLSRAVAPLATLMELTLPFCKVGGRAFAYKKGDIEEETRQGEYALKLLGGKLKAIHQVNLPEFTDHRVLIDIEKVLPTPDLYPRRAGVPGKKPLHEKS